MKTQYQCRWCTQSWDELPKNTKFISVSGAGHEKFSLVLIENRAHTIVKKVVASVDVEIYKEAVPLAAVAEFNPESFEEIEDAA